MESSRQGPTGNTDVEAWSMTVSVQIEMTECLRTKKIINISDNSGWYNTK